ncbi:uncharacterized protein LY89DRAFT_195516 [Mollisia scopiformis]|uniref:BZIP domain-containing protein n=1 Tax=Mollisia scopiformis TaxID=149040 RepID=A0A194WY16_MOLSC|nr:uncharacterized protein LY89DRAFT_195516 [Mollisia scopiformis]KUJ12866.1 hypothetical protein LY89DRAFT_195516 [Mollisia scopiformis]
MDRYSQQKNTGPATNQYSTFDQQFGYDQDSQNNGSLASDEYWCQACALPFTECLCYIDSSPLSSQQNYSNYNAPQIKSLGYSQLAFPSTYATSSSSTTSSYYTTATGLSQPAYSTIAPATSSGEGARNLTPPESATKRKKRKGSMPPEEAREKRLEQNRRSQRHFRDRQARLVVDLKQKVEILTEENEKLVNELSKVSLRDSSRDSKSPGTDYSSY